MIDSPIQRVSRPIARLLFMCFLLCVLPPNRLYGQNILTDNAEQSEHFLIQMSGTVYQEKFFRARGQLTIAPPPNLSLNSYLVIVEGFPQENSRNCFFWNSEASSMITLSNEIVCDIKNTWLKFNDNHFFYLSPTLLANKGPFLTQREKERRLLAEKQALPTKVFAKAGKLVVSRNGDSISGTVWMNGYDFVQSAYVQYNARFQGTKSLRLEPSKQRKK